MDGQERKVGEGLRKVLLKEGSALIPFGLFSKRFRRYWGEEDNGSKNNVLRRCITNAFPTALGAVYVMTSLVQGGNPLKPQYFFRDMKRHSMQIKREVRDESDRRFYEADKNGDLVLDSNEFYDYAHGGRE